VAKRETYIHVCLRDEVSERGRRAGSGGRRHVKQAFGCAQKWVQIPRTLRHTALLSSTHRASVPERRHAAGDVAVIRAVRHPACT